MCYGARTTRGGGIDQPVDLSSSILLENLKVSGYRLADRLVGLDLRYVATRLARFHATVVVIKLKKPDVFKETVMKTIFEVKKEPPYFGDDFPGLIAILEVLSHLPVVNQHMGKLKEEMGNMINPRDKRLMVMYHSEFSKCLEIFGCDAEAFAYDDFLKKIEIEAPKIFFRAFMILRISSLAESNVPDLSNKSKMFSVFKENSGLGDTYFKKVENLVKEFVDRNWL
ncbi:hypothetical protein PR048_031125 [Dryococelus australis]|uniref:Uncharacterized protein n=1 Tax=Dryococelus australis TaxID=614101 RepID=A0ABQ9G4D1_9NEOP|nr:hypothetical protein PR048_031125 [Dryococelus australis]